jgi:hypothetical protein
MTEGKVLFGVTPKSLTDVDFKRQHEYETETTSQAQ